MEKQNKDCLKVEQKFFQDQTQNDVAEKTKRQNSPIREGNPVPELLSGLPSEGSGRVLRFRSSAAPIYQPLIKPEVSSSNIYVETPSSNNIDAQSQTEDESVIQSCTASSYSTRDATSATSVIVTVEDFKTSNTREQLNDESVFDNDLHEELESISHHAQFLIGDSDGSSSASNRSSDIRADQGPSSDLPPPPSYDSACKLKASKHQRNLSSLTVDSIQPPTYRDAVGAGRFLEDAPPNYHTLFANSVFRMMDFGEHSINGDERPISFIACIITYCLISVMVVFCACMVFMLPLAMIIVGVTHLHSCPAQPRIPVFLTSMGVFQLLECCGRCSMYIYTKLKAQNHRDEVRYKSKDPFVYFIVVWFVVGSMWVYQNYPTCHDFVLKNAELKQEIKGEHKFGGKMTNISLGTTLDTFGTTKRGPLIRTNHTDEINGNISVSEKVYSTPTTKATRPFATQKNKSEMLYIHTTKPFLRQSTTMKPMPKRKAACCGRVVYFFTFGIVTFYYSIIGLLFIVHICGSFIKLLCKCRDNRH